MAKEERRYYTEEFKKETVALVQNSTKSKTQIARELGISDRNISRWCQEYGSEESRHEEGLPSLQEYTALKAELRRVTEERDILKKALNIFSRNG